MLYDDAEGVKDKGLTGKQARSLTGLQSFGLIAWAVCLFRENYLILWLSVGNFIYLCHLIYFRIVG